MECPTRALLELLVSDEALPSAAEWRDAVRRIGAEEMPTGNKADDASGASVLVVAAVEKIVPHLAEYRTLREKLYSLMKFCEQQYPAELFDMVAQWAVLPTTPNSMQSLAFKQWLLGYIEKEHDRLVCVNALRWKQAVLLAALREEDKTVKARWLRYIDTHLGSMEGVVAAPAEQDSELLRFLAFCWRHSVQLSQSVALCAAKFATLASSFAAFPETDGVFAFLRWARVLKPFFFERFVNIIVGLKIIPKYMERELTLPDDLVTFLHRASPSQDQIMEHLKTEQQRIHDCFQKRSTDIELVHHDRAQRLASVNLPPNLSCIRAHISRDLAIVPTDIFPHAFAAFTVLVRSLVAIKEHDVSTLNAISSSVTTLVSLFESRYEDSCLFMLHASIRDFHFVLRDVWAHSPTLFSQVIAELSGDYILETSVLKKWVYHVTLRAIIADCDRSLLNEYKRILDTYLPQEIATATMSLYGN